MRVLVTAVEARGPLTCVAFAADVGEGCGWWRSADTPDYGEQRHVELEFPETVGEFRVLPTKTPPSLTLDGEVVTVTAHVVAVDDRVATVSLGGDVVLLELPGATRGDCINFAASTIDLYPYDL